MKINYSNYTLTELKEALSTIDKNLYPERYEQLLKEHEIRVRSESEKNKQEELKHIEREKSKTEYHLYKKTESWFASSSTFSVKRFNKIIAEVEKKDLYSYRFDLSNSNIYNKEESHRSYKITKSGYVAPNLKLFENDKLISYITTDQLFSFKSTLIYKNQTFVLNSEDLGYKFSIFSNETLIAELCSDNPSVIGYFYGENNLPVYIIIFLLCSIQSDPTTTVTP